MRKIINFNNDWYFSRTDTWEAVDIPHTWNAVDGQDGGNDYYRGTCMYKKEFKRPEITEDECVFLEFEGAAMTAEVFLNGKKLAHHEDGYSTFRVDITNALEEKNILSVSVDNSENDHVYPQRADFTFYGGIYRDVKMIIVPKVHFELIKDGTPGIKVTPEVQGRNAAVTVESWQNTDGIVHFSIWKPDGCGVRYWRERRSGEKETDEKISCKSQDQCIARMDAKSVDGYARADFVINDVHLWDGKKDPFLYIVRAELEEGIDSNSMDETALRFGCRSFDFDKEKGFFLNGKSCPLRGVSRHQDRAGVGNALTKEMHEEDIDLILETGANTVRLAHYQHAQYFYALCDEAGLAVWAEIPYITRHLPNGKENTLVQMRELVTQCCHHPSIICWGLSNEITVSGGVSEDLMENHRLLNDLCHHMDKTRPTTMAHVFMLETESPLIDVADIGSYNLYFGWYLGELEQNDSFFDRFHAEYPERIIGFSEYGADANPQYQSASPERGDYIETYQCVYHEHLLKCIEERPYLWATHVWNMLDFAADGRDEGGKNGVNQKGLVTMDRKIKKDAFYLYKSHWNKEEPFVHICGRRYADRVPEAGTEEAMRDSGQNTAGISAEQIGKTTEIKVYSNQDRVDLFVDGELVGSKEGRYIFTFRILLTGVHTETQKESRMGGASECGFYPVTYVQGYDAEQRSAGKLRDRGV